MKRLKERALRYIYDPEPMNDDPDGAPLWCLGIEYQAFADKDQKDSVSPRSREWPSNFLDDFEAKIWMTYRYGFALIAKTHKSPSSNVAQAVQKVVDLLGTESLDDGGYTRDVGWGCMIRSTQSVLANTLVMLSLGREWRRGKNVMEERQILRQFADDDRAPFSIHNFVRCGDELCSTAPGEWFGPSVAGRCIKSLCNTATALDVYLNGDGGDIYEADLLSALQTQPVLILLGVRLGIETINPIYYEALKSCLKYPQSIGIAGGRPSSSHYFVAVQSSHLFYLDPHQQRVALPWRDNVMNYTDEEIDTCHSRRLRRMKIDDMDPSMLLSFLIKDEADWSDFKIRLKDINGKAIIHIHAGRPKALGRSNSFHSTHTDLSASIQEEYVLDMEMGLSETE